MYWPQRGRVRQLKLQGEAVPRRQKALRQRAGSREARLVGQHEVVAASGDVLLAVSSQQGHVPAPAARHARSLAVLQFIFAATAETVLI